MKEYVLDPDEFSALSKGRVHWAIMKEPIYISKMDGTGRIDSGDLALYLSVTAKAKDENHVIAMKVGCGSINRFADNYQERLKQIRAAAKEDFPKATEGAFE
jgi:ABC-type transporter Mla MlaB component